MTKVKVELTKIFDGGQTIVVIYGESVEDNEFHMLVKKENGSYSRIKTHRFDVVCRGWDKEYVMKVISDIARDNDSDQLRNIFNMKPCPVCGCKDVHITNIMRGITNGSPVVVAKMGVCTACKYHGQKVYASGLRKPFTEASWTRITVNLWNNTPVTSFFKICEDTFGSDYQYACNSEEVFELMEALTRYGKITARNQRPDRQQSNHDIISEMADVIICIYQLLYTRNVSPEVLNNVMREKINRTCLHESVRTAIASLSRKVTEATTINVPIVDESSQNPQ